jgi:hypothetical protein
MPLELWLLIVGSVLRAFFGADLPVRRPRNHKVRPCSILSPPPASHFDDGPFGNG